MSKNATHGGELIAKVDTLVGIMKSLVDRGVAQGDVTVEDWNAMEEVVATDAFRRVGPFHDALDWAGYTTMLTQWVNHSEGWTPVVKKRVEAEDVVFLQCEEMLTHGDSVVPFYSLSMYEFNAEGKIASIQVYMQQEASE